MRTLAFLAWVLCCGGWAGAAVAQTPPPVAAPLPPLEQFFRNADLQAAALSPGGDWLAVTAAAGNGRYALLMFNVSGNAPPAVVAHFRDTDVANFHWVNDERLVYDVVDLERGSADARYAPGLFSVKRDGTELRQLIQMRRHFVTGPPRTAERTLSPVHRLLHVPVPVPGPDGSNDEVVVGEARYSRWGELEALVPKRLNVVTGQTRTLALGTPADTTAWLFDAQGQPRVAMQRKAGRLRVHWRADTTQASPEAWALLGQLDANAAAWVPRFVDAAGQLYVTAPRGPAGELVLKRFDFARGQPEAEAVVATPGFDFAGAVIAESAGSRLLGVRVDTDAESTVWFDPRLKAL